MTRVTGDGLAVVRAGRRLLDGVSVALQPGVLVGLVGPNGAGKSTLLRCLAGLLRPDEGEVRLDGRAVSAIGAGERGRLVGYVPQSFAPAWDYSVRDVLALGAGRAGGARGRLPGTIRAHELEELLDRSWSRLSGGERARTLLAAVLVAEPPVLLADEPGASLDIRHRIALLERLSAYAQGRVVVAAMHDLDLAARFCDRLIVLDAGRVALDEGRASAVQNRVLDRVFAVDFDRREVGAEARPILPVVPALDR